MLKTISKIVFRIVFIIVFTGCNKTQVSDRGDGVLGEPEHNCHFLCTDKGEDDNFIVCQQCDDGDLPFCAELDDSQANIYCNNELTS
jgi:hypothetical protein